MTTAMTLRHDSWLWGLGAKTGIDVPRKEFITVLYMSISVNTKINTLIRGGGGGGGGRGRRNGDDRGNVTDRESVTGVYGRL